MYKRCTSLVDESQLVANFEFKKISTALKWRLLRPAGISHIPLWLIAGLGVPKGNLMLVGFDLSYYFWLYFSVCSQARNIRLRKPEARWPRIFHFRNPLFTTASIMSKNTFIHGQNSSKFLLEFIAVKSFSFLTVITQPQSILSRKINDRIRWHFKWNAINLHKNDPICKQMRYMLFYRLNYCQQSSWIFSTIW